MRNFNYNLLNCDLQFELMKISWELVFLQKLEIKDKGIWINIELELDKFGCVLLLMLPISLFLA